MTLRTLLVHADSDERFAHRLALSTAIAREYEARLILVYVLKTPESLGLYGEPMGAPAVELIEQELNAERERAERLRVSVGSSMATESVSWDWRTTQGPVVEGLAAAGASADLIVMGQPQEPGATTPVAQVAMSAGRPVLCVPHAGTFATLGRRVLVAWRGTREATRALHDALPLLIRASHVILFAGDGEEGSAQEAVRHLADHGIKAELRHTALDDIDAGTAILNAVADSSSDLLVMGVYGHSRLRELVFGGATRTVLRSMTVPTLISH